MIKMVHMVQTIAVKDRAVFLSNIPPMMSLRELTGGDLMSTQDDHLCLSSKPCYVLCSRYGQSIFLLLNSRSLLGIFSQSISTLLT